MFARGGDGIEQNFFGNLERARLLHRGQSAFDMFVLGVKSFLLSHLVEIRFQWLDEQIVFGLGMRSVQLFHQRGETFDFRQSFHARRGDFDVVEQIVEDRVFRAQDVGNFHGVSRLLSADNIHQIACYDQPFFANRLP